MFCSPFRRCRQTIEPAAAELGLEVELDEEIGEVFVGEWEGLSLEEIVSGDVELARKFREQEATFGLSPGGESGEQLRARVVPAMERIIDSADGREVVVVTHGGVINAYVGHLLGIEHEMFFLPENASVNTVQLHGDLRSVRFLNDTRHLTEPAFFAPSEEAGEAAG